MARSTLSENDVIYLLDKKVELLLIRHIILIRFGILGGIFVKLQLLMAGYLLTCKTTVCVERRFFFISYDSIVFAFLCIIFEFMQNV